MSLWALLQSAPFVHDVPHKPVCAPPPLHPFCRNVFVMNLQGRFYRRRGGLATYVGVSPAASWALDFSQIHREGTRLCSVCIKSLYLHFTNTPPRWTEEAQITQELANCCRVLMLSMFSFYLNCARAKFQSGLGDKGFYEMRCTGLIPWSDLLSLLFCAKYILTLYPYLSARKISTDLHALFKQFSIEKHLALEQIIRHFVCLCGHFVCLCSNFVSLGFCFWSHF